MIKFVFLTLTISLYFHSQNAFSSDAFLDTRTSKPCLDQRDHFSDQLIIEGFCRITNQERTRRKLKSLKLDPSLSDVAQSHAEDMAKRGYFSHINLDGESPFDRISEARIPYRAAAENISRGYRTSGAALQGFMNSPGHRRNILGTSYGKIGIGFFENHWVQVFTN